MAKEVNGELTKFGYDDFGVLSSISDNKSMELSFDFDLLGRLRHYMTDDRDSTFNYDGTKRLGDLDDEWKRYHWCRSQFLGYKDDTNTYYIVPDAEGSTKVIFTDAGSVVNRLDYDHLGYIRNKTTEPQVEVLWKQLNYIADLNLYLVYRLELYNPLLGGENTLKSINNLSPTKMPMIKIINIVPYPDITNEENSAIQECTHPGVAAFAAVVVMAIIGGVYVSGHIICCLEKPVWATDSQGRRYVHHWECVKYCWVGSII